MPIPHLTIKHKDDPPPPPSEPLSKEQQRKAFYKTNRWAIVGGIALFIALIGIGYTVYAVISFIRKSGETISSVQDVKTAVSDSFVTSKDKGGWILGALPSTELLAYAPLLSGEHHMLVLLQNSTELRPTGGFIGNLATLRTQGDTLLNYKTFDSYSVDTVNGTENAKRFPIAPRPIKDYLGQERLFLRDSNWFPDFRDSAQLVSTLYPILSLDTTAFDSIIAVNPSVLADTLGLLGPVVVEGIEFNRDNFIEALEYEVEINAPIYKGKSISERKAIVNALLHELVSRITSLPKKQQLEFVKLAHQKLQEKEIQLYFRDQSLQEATERLGYGGAFPPCPADCLSVIDANLRALKTDAAVSRSIAYSVRERAGDVTAKLVLTYTNNGYYDWKTTDYRSYTRVYLPPQTKLISAKKLNTELRIYEPLETRDEGIYRGRSTIGFLHTTNVKTTGEIVLEYELPRSVWEHIQQRAYPLAITKQSGTNPTFSFKADFDDPITSVSGINATSDNGNISSESKLTQDLAITLSL